MEIICKARDHGKTHEIIQRTIASDGVLAVHSDKEASRIEEQYPELKGRVVVSHMIGKQNGRLYDVYNNNFDPLGDFICY